MALVLARRLAALLVTLAAATVIVFVVMEVLPGDPAAIILGVGAQPDTLAALRAELGLDLPVGERYGRWVLGLLSGDLGTSYTYSVPVSELIAERIWVSLPLALIAMALTTVIAIPAGVFAAARHGRMADTGVSALAQIGIAIPNFWFAMVLILIFAVWLGWVPAGGFAGWDEGPGAALKSLALPAIALALPQAAILTRVTRSSVLETLGEDYIRTARAKGLTWNAALWRHGVRNALIPVVTIMGLQFSFLLAGTIIIENVFYLPGLGRLLFQAISQRDLIVVKDLVVLLAGTVVIVNFLVDVAYLALDPRLRRGRAHAL
ncbi:ABC transporter, permease protein 1 (cluster 5, nickel/peptides/opines) [hydrothermal vent metagenome]|uniref:ABC transporter, permease protein 1 (Cluster 5, nickel/peptides/opines) n=1 Tax=hydrothermal vent metagenome TaxID=652676 RepID=A0A3B0TV97_9ZZZZ